MRLDLRAHLLAWVLAPLTLLAAVNALAGYRSARDTANLVADRTLLASARVIAEAARAEDGRLQVPVARTFALASAADVAQTWAAGRPLLSARA